MQRPYARGYLSRTLGKWLVMFGFGTSAVATLVLIFGSPVAMCALIYVLVRLEPVVRQQMRLVDATARDASPEGRSAESAA